MGVDSLAVPSLILNSTLLIVLALMATSCASSPLIPYAVELVSPPEVTLPPIPQVLAEPVQSSVDYREFKAASGEQRYFVPVRLTALADSNRARAIMLESHDGKRAVFQAVIGPPALPVNTSLPSPVLYPIDRLTVRTLTSPQDPTLWRVTISSEPIQAAPYTFLLNIQVLGEAT
jgi:hypothetical protein